MRKSLLSALCLATFLCSAQAAEYKAVPDWYKLAPGRPQMGNLHGDVAVSSKGEVYVSVMDPKASASLKRLKRTRKSLARAWCIGRLRGC